MVQDADQIIEESNQHTLSGQSSSNTLSQNDGKRKARVVQNKEYSDKEDAGLARNGRKRLINGKVYTA